MGLWVLEPNTTEKVPGTVHLERETEAQRALTANLKHGENGQEHIVLVPQPSDSPNDPLNWPTLAKHFHSWFLSAGTGLVSGTGYFLNPSNSIMAQQMHTTVTQVSRTSAVGNLGLGVFSILSTPAARIWGKRPIFLLLNLLGVIGYAIWLSHPYNINYAYAGRFLYGGSQSALEYLVSSSVGDLFFVHERGFHLALWHFGLAGGNSIGQVIGSQIVGRQSFVWAVTYANIVFGVYFVLFVLFAPETTYVRARKFDTDVHEKLADETDSVSSSEPKQPNSSEGLKQQATDTEIRESGPEPVPEKKKTYLQGLKVYNGRFSTESYFPSLVSPFITYALPAVAWASYAYGITVAFAGAFSVTIGGVFGVAPYNFSTSSIGLTVLAPFTGTVIGNFTFGPLADWVSKYMSRKNKGVYEPEFRLVLVAPSFILGLMGFWGFGLSIHAKAHWVAPVFFFGLSTGAGSILSLISNTYLLDCHRKHAQDGYAAVTLVKSILAFALSFAINDWVANRGVVEVFFIIGLFHGIACVWGGVLYFYGKKLRYWVHKNEFLQAHLREFESNQE